MTVVRYTGILDPTREVEALRPAAEHLTLLMMLCKPFGTDYHVLSAARQALVTAAFHFTKDPTYFGSSPPSG